MPSTYLLIAHGSRDPRPQIALEKLSHLLQAQLASLADSAEKPLVRTGVLELGPTSLEQQIQQMAEDTQAIALKQVQLLPLFLLPGTHVMSDIPQAIAVAQPFSPQVQIALRPYLGSHGGVADLLAKQLENVDNHPVDRWILLSHGSRRSGGNAPVEKIAEQLNMVPAYWFVTPDLETQIQQLAASGCRRIGILPYFLFAGTTTDGVALEVERLRTQWPQLDLKLALLLKPSAELAALVMDLMQLPARATGSTQCL